MAHHAAHIRSDQVVAHVQPKVASNHLVSAASVRQIRETSVRIGCRDDLIS